MFKFIFFSCNARSKHIQRHAIQRVKDSLIFVLIKSVKDIEKIQMKTMDSSDRRSYASVTFYLTSAIQELDKADDGFTKSRRIFH